MEFAKLNNKHEDVITDISFDYYGKRFASCSPDKHIKIWTLNEKDNNWTCFDIQSAHNEAIWRLSWAHPEFGQLLASCSEDRTVNIWEEQENVNGMNKEQRNKWIKKASLVESRRAINDVKFAPKHLGLKLASASSDGCVRIYEATDIFSLTFWQLQDTLRVEHTDYDSNDTSQSNTSEHGLTSLSWCDSPFESPRLAIGGYSKRAVVYAFINNNWTEECVLGTHGDTVHDIAWAPCMGRSYHLIATASRESTFQVHKLNRKENGGGLEYAHSTTIQAINNSPVWRVAWNATGTVLATSSEDGTLALFRRNFSGNWVNIQVLQASADHFQSLYEVN